MLGLYIHIPFCKKICSYCDFYKLVSSVERKQEFIEVLIEEMKIKKIEQYSFDTIYIGGGTPSSLSLSQLETILNELSKKIAFSKIKEFTIEVNPEDITEELIDLFVRFKVNRVSVGIQTFSKKLQKLINREIEFIDVKNKIDLLRKKGIKNINVDLMYAIPTETFLDLNQDLEKVLSLNVDHLSAYSLILEEKTILYHLYQKGKIELLDELEEAKMYHHIIDTLNNNGFEHYEISNFSKKGYQSLHNLIYWNCEEYVALGPSGSFYLDDTRGTNVSNLNKYLVGIKENKNISEEIDILSLKDKMEEQIILGLRKIEGINILKFEKIFNIPIKKAFPKIEKLIEEHLLIEEKKFIYIPKEHLYICNHILVKILE